MQCTRHDVFKYRKIEPVHTTYHANMTDKFQIFVIIVSSKQVFSLMYTFDHVSSPSKIVSRIGSKSEGLSRF